MVDNLGSRNQWFGKFSIKIWYILMIIWYTASVENNPTQVGLDIWYFFSIFDTVKLNLIQFNII